MKNSLNRNKPLDILGTLRGSIRPDPNYNIADWADNKRYLSGIGAAEPGRWRTSRTPYLREIMTCLSPQSAINRTVLMSSAQVGKTETGNNFVGYVIDHAPGPTLIVFPTIEAAERHSRQRIDALIESSPSIREKVSGKKSRDSNNTVLSKKFSGGILFLTGANSAVGLKSMPAKYIVCDEVDEYPPSVDGQGDAIALAEARATTFGKKYKLYMVSTPTIKGASRIELEFARSDQRYYYVPCPFCDHKQKLVFANLKWPENEPHNAQYYCCECGSAIAEHYKTQMLANGQWRASAPFTDTAGFHLNALYSPVGWLSWSAIASRWLEAQKSTDALCTFVNTVLGEPWVEHGDAPDWQLLWERRDLSMQIGVVPADALLVTAGVDVQKDRIECSLWAWGATQQSWLVDHIVLHGGPQSAECWSKLTKLLHEPLPTADGQRVKIALMAIDSGYESTAVYAWARKMGRIVMPVKGIERFDRAQPVGSPTDVDFTLNGKRYNKGCKLYTVAVSTFKIEAYRRLKQQKTATETPNGYINLPNVDIEYFKQLCAEQLKTVVGRNGFNKLEWQKLRDRNEALDCLVYARAALYVLGADRYGDRFWSQPRKTLNSGNVVATIGSNVASNDWLDNSTVSNWY